MWAGFALLLTSGLMRVNLCADQPLHHVTTLETGQSTESSVCNGNADCTPTEGDTVPTTTVNTSSMVGFEDGHFDNTARDTRLIHNLFAPYLVYPEGILTKADHVKILPIISVIALFVCFVGILGNILTLVVYSRMKNNATNIYICGLTVLDLFYLIGVLPPFILPLILREKLYVSKFYLYYTTYGSRSTVMWIRKSIIMVTMMMSIERFLAITFPIKNLKITKRPKITIFLLCGIVFIGHIYLYCMYYVTDNEDTKTKHIKPAMLPTEFLSSNPATVRVLGYIVAVLFVYAPIFIILACNVCLILALRRYRFKGKYKASGEDDITTRNFFILQRQKAILILVYTFIFVLLAMPHFINVIVAHLIPDFNPAKKEHYLHLTIQRIYGILDVISSSMNFFVYVTMSSSFKEHLQNLCCGTVT